MKGTLARHQGIFGTERNDLEWANHFEHKITTKDDNPT
jgi:hypothetical protein